MPQEHEADSLRRPDPAMPLAVLEKSAGKPICTRTDTRFSAAGNRHPAPLPSTVRRTAYVSNTPRQMRISRRRPRHGGGQPRI